MKYANIDIRAVIKANIGLERNNIAQNEMQVLTTPTFYK